jgi:hypothetical protein
VQIFVPEGEPIKLVIDFPMPKEKNPIMQISALYSLLLKLNVLEKQA